VRIVGRYSFKNGAEIIGAKYGILLSEVEEAIDAIDSRAYKTKESREITMAGRMLYNPSELNEEFKRQFSNRGWRNVRVPSTYSTSYYVPGYRPAIPVRTAFRDMDFVKQRLGVEIQFGKYAFMVYNVCAKMTIFHKLGHIDAGVEVVPVKSFADSMSTGVSYFEQFVWDLENRGEADIDIPVLILGIDAAAIRR